MTFPTIESFVGNTPLVRLQRLPGETSNIIMVKLEGNNPAGSVKDRPALSMIQRAEARGDIKPGDTLIEATSGNTGIGLAMVCAHKGYPLVIVMAESFSVERRKLMRYLGAKVVLTPAAQKGTGMVAKAVELAEKNGWWQSRQFENPANAEMHARTTAAEIIEDFADNSLDHWVTGHGTGGTITGVSRYIKQARGKQILSVAVEPIGSPVISQTIAGEELKPSPHKIQGIGAGFVPDVLDQKLLDGIEKVENDDALEMARRLAKEEGILCGISSGAAVQAAVQTFAKSMSSTMCSSETTGAPSSLTRVMTPRN